MRLKRGPGILLCAILCNGAVSAAVAQDRTVPGAFAIEAAGGTLGSALGLGTALLVSNPSACPTDDIACILERLGVAGLASAAGATVVSWGGGRLTATDPSLIGAAIGSVAGVLAGVGLLKLIEESSSGDLNPAVAFVGFTVTHGVVTALGSRIVAALRGPRDPPTRDR